MPAPDPIAELLRHLADSLRDGTFVRLTLTRPVRPADDLERVLGRCVEIKGQAHFSLTFRYTTRDVTKNIPLDAANQWAREQLAGKFRGALLATTKCDWQLTGSKAGKFRLIAHRPGIIQPPSHRHDVEKNSLLDDSAHDWLAGLGVVDSTGKVRASMADKYRQIDRYLEITHLAKDAGLRTVADMGCGKGYLTFGMWHLFRNEPVKVIGVEQRPELVNSANQLARQIGAEGLEFVAGTIESVAIPALDALIALHACDTATDDAICRGIAAGAKLIIVAPCCHKEVRPQLGKPEPFAGALRHGLMAGRMAEWVTDALRVEFLDWAGYEVKVIEFVASEHTPKNLMIAAVKKKPAFVDVAAAERIAQLKEFFGIEHQALDRPAR